MDHLLSLFSIVFAAKAGLTLIGAMYFYLYKSDTATRKTLVGFMRFCVPVEILRSKCLRIDAMMFGLTKLVGFGGAIPIGLLIAAVSPPIYLGLEHAFGATTPPSYPLVAAAIMMVAVVVVRDFTDFYLHYLAHRWQWLWEFHAVHHSTVLLNPLSGKRAHFVDDLIHTGVSGAVVAVLVGGLSYVLGVPDTATSSWGLNAFLVAHLLTFNELQHSHIALSFGRMERFFMSPAQHHLHHDRDSSPRNLGALFAVWDRMFKTFESSAPLRPFVCGLPAEMAPHYDSILKMMLRPFRNNWAHLVSLARRVLRTAPQGDAPMTTGSLPSTL